MKCKFCRRNTDATNGVCHKCAKIVDESRPVIAALLLARSDTGRLSDEQIKAAVVDAHRLLHVLCENNPIS